MGVTVVGSPSDPCLLVSTPLYGALPHYLGDQQNTADITCLPSDVMKDTAASTLLPLGLITLGEASQHVVRTLEQSCGEKGGLLPTASIDLPPTRLSHLGIASSSPRQDWTDILSLKHPYLTGSDRG